MTDTLRPARPVHPGCILRREMEARAWVAEDVAVRCQLTSLGVERILANESTLSAKTIARELAHAFGTSPEFWLNLQRQYDEAMAASKEEP